MIETTNYWSDDFIFALSVCGGMGLFLGEALVNALRHGKPGSRPRFKISLDHLRQELSFSLENDLRGGDGKGERLGKKYGGRSILDKPAWLFGWRDLNFERSADPFRLSWSVTVVERHKDESD